MYPAPQLVIRVITFEVLFCIKTQYTPPTRRNCRVELCQRCVRTRWQPTAAYTPPTQLNSTVELRRRRRCVLGLRYTTTNHQRHRQANGLMDRQHAMAIPRYCAVKPCIPTCADALCYFPLPLNTAIALYFFESQTSYQFSF